MSDLPNDYEYYKDFESDILWRWNGSKLEVWEDEDAWGDSWYDDLADVNYAYAGSVHEAVRVDSKGERL